MDKSPIMDSKIVTECAKSIASARGGSAAGATGRAKPAGQLTSVSRFVFQVMIVQTL